jgi:hypothetical protein
MPSLEDDVRQSAERPAAQPRAAVSVLNCVRTRRRGLASLRRASHAKATKELVAKADGCSGLILIQASPCDLPIIGRLLQGKCATAQEEDRCDSTTASTATIAASIYT